MAEIKKSKFSSSDLILSMLTGFSRDALEREGTTFAGKASAPESSQENALYAMAESMGLNLGERPDLGVHLVAAREAVPRLQKLIGPAAPTAVRAAGVGKEMLDQVASWLGTGRAGFDEADLAANELGIQQALEQGSQSSWITDALTTFTNYMSNRGKGKSSPSFIRG